MDINDNQIKDFFLSLNEDIDFIRKGHGRWLLRPMKDLDDLVNDEFTPRDLVNACQHGKQYETSEPFNVHDEYFTLCDNVYHAGVVPTHEIKLVSVPASFVQSYVRWLIEYPNGYPRYTYRYLIGKVYSHKELSEEAIKFILRYFFND